MKRIFLSAVSLLLAIVATSCLLTGCKGKSKGIKASVIESSEERVVIKVQKIEEEATLIDVMNFLEEEGELTFDFTGGMMVEINGKRNDIDYSPCWMLYTSDANFSNGDWGTTNYDEREFGSAIVGASTLLVVEGEFYVWEYRSF